MLNVKYGKMLNLKCGKMLNSKCGKMLNVVKCYHKIRSTPITGSQTTKFEDFPNQETRKD